MRRESYRIWWNNAELGPLRRSRSFKVTDVGTNGKLIYDFLLGINTNLPPILHRFRDIAFDRSKIAIFYYSCLTPTAEGFLWDDLREIFSGCQRMAKVPNALEKIWTAWVGRTSVTDDRQTTDGRAIHIAKKRRIRLQILYHLLKSSLLTRTRGSVPEPHGGFAPPASIIGWPRVPLTFWDSLPPMSAKHYRIVHKRVSPAETTTRCSQCK